MKLSHSVIVALGTYALSVGWAFAQDGEDGDEGENADLEVTITLMHEDAHRPEHLMEDIALPTDGVDEEGNPIFIPSEAGLTNSAFGLERANAAREDGQAFGEAMSTAAHDRTENLGRGMKPDLQDLLPDQAPDVPGGPDGPNVPSPPGRP